jgi:thiol-disulfide isomerase/thioredoxin
VVCAPLVAAPPAAASGLARHDVTTSPDTTGQTGAAPESADDPATTSTGDADHVAVSGEPLAPLPDAGSDPAVGQPMPTLSGTTLDGEDLVVPAAGRQTVILYVAHWCPHCQREVPTVQQWVDDGGLPDGVDLVTVSTAIDPRRPNYPPAAWLEREGWTAPVLTDGDGAAATAAGLTAYPYFVAVDAEGRVAVRASGELTTEQLDAVVSEIADE